MNRWLNKTITTMGAIIVMCLCMSGCGSKGNTLLADADVDSGALALWKYDGETATRGYLFDITQRREVLEQLAQVPVTEVTDWSPSQLEAPMYGFHILNKQGFFTSALWSKDLWITEDGRAYRFHYDVGELLASYEWQSVDSFSDEIYMPCSHALSYVDGAWDTTWMMSAKELTAAEGIEIQLVQWGQESVTVTLSNHSQGEWTFGEYYHLEVLLDGVWYHVPQAPGKMWAVHDLAYILTPGGEKEMTYSLIPYGELPAGRYRLVAEAFEEGLAVEADVTMSP